MVGAPAALDVYADPAPAVHVVKDGDTLSQIALDAGVERVVRLLGVGSSGPDVLALQQKLDSLGYWVPADGSYGALMQQAVWAYEKVQGLSRDGVFGADE